MIKEYIDKNFIIITSKNVAKQIKGINSDATVCVLDDFACKIEDNWNVNCYLVDSFYWNHKAVKRLRKNKKNEVVEWKATIYAIEQLAIMYGKESKISKVSTNLNVPMIKSYYIENEKLLVVNIRKSFIEGAEKDRIKKELRSTTGINNVLVIEGTFEYIPKKETKSIESVFYGDDGLEYRYTEDE